MRHITNIKGMLWSVQSVVKSGALWDRLPILRYVVVSTVSGAVVNVVDRLPILKYVVVSTASGAVGSVLGQIANIKVCCGQDSQWCSREHCGADCQD